MRCRLRRRRGTAGSHHLPIRIRCHRQAHTASAVEWKAAATTMGGRIC